MIVDRTVTWEHEFVDSMPAKLEPSVLYVSIRYRTSKHLCPCGCGFEVVTPIRPNKWCLKYDGTTVSLYPSVGNWSLECKSHYWIRDNEIVWSRPWSDLEIAMGRQRQLIDDGAYFGQTDGAENSCLTERGGAGSLSLFSRLRDYVWRKGRSILSK